MLLHRVRGLTHKIISTQKRFISALYVTGDKANENYSILTPYFEFNKKLSNRQLLTENINRRKLKSIDLDEIYQLWDVYKNVQCKKSNLERRRIEISNELKEILNKEKNDLKSEDIKVKKNRKEIESENVKNENWIRKLKLDGITVREDLKLLKENSYNLEDTFIHRYLSLPNDLHEDIIQDNSVIRSHMVPEVRTELENNTKNKSNELLLEYLSPQQYFLKNEAAELDLFLPHKICNHFYKLGFIQFSNPDFCKSIIVEAAGINTANNTTTTTTEQEVLFTVKSDSQDNKTTTSSVNLLHLIGSGSMLSFLGYITKLSLFKSVLPLKFISNGREYIKKNQNYNLPLLNVNQSTQVQLFQIAIDKQQADQLFNQTINDIHDLYIQFGLSHRMIYVPADQLTLAECQKVNVELFVPSLQNYITIGSISSYDDFISKRLLFNYKDSNDKSMKFPYIISGTVVNIANLLAVLMENSHGNTELYIKKLLL